jgi:hypothetical protein
MQENHSFFPQKQENFEGKIGNVQILQALQKTHPAQRNEIAEGKCLPAGREISNLKLGLGYARCF